MWWLALADDYDPTEATDELPEWVAPDQGPDGIPAAPEDPRKMRIEHDSTMEMTSIGGMTFTRFKPRWSVLDGEGEVDVPTLVVRLHDGEVRDRRRKEVVGTAVSGGIGGLLVVGAFGLLASGATERSDGASVGAALLGGAGAITLILGPGNAVYRNGRPDKYWELDDMQERLDDWNEELRVDPAEATGPDEAE